MRSIAHISDVHFGRHDPRIAEDLLASVNNSGANLVVLSGDLTQRARHAEFSQARQFLERIEAPRLVVPGNHDVPLYDLWGRFFSPLVKYNHYVAPLGLGDGLFRDEELAVLGLNTARSFTRKNGRLSLEQIAQIGSAFGNLPHGVFKAVVTHHPLAIPTGETQVELAGRSALALRTLAGTGVHLLLSGHHHRALSGGVTEITEGGSILAVHAGTAISTRLRGAEGNSYNQIRIEQNRVFVAVFAWTAGQGFRQNRIGSFVFVEGEGARSGWHPEPK